MKYVMPVLLLLAGCTANENNLPETADDKQSGVVLPAGYEPFAKDTLSVLSWNVEHFVDGNDNPYINASREDDPDSLMGNREQLLTKALQKADADIVVLQEFENVAYLNHLADSLLPEMNYRFFADAESYNWYMNVVVMSRVPLGTVYSYGAVHTPVLDYVNENGEVETQNYINTRMWSADVFVNNSYDFVLTGLHLKAGRGERNEGMRLGQIKFLKGQFNRFLNENPATNLLVVGDLNSTPDSREIQTLLEGENGAAFVDPLAGTSTYSHPSDSPFWRIDHILPNKNMAEELVPESVQVKQLLPEEEQQKVSDHLPLMAKFIVNE